MKRYMRGMAAFALSVGTIAAIGGSTASAQACDITIGNTGPGSDNSVDCEVNNSTKYVCENNIWVTNTNYQESESGNAGVDGNTSGGGATSGDAGNTNGTNLDVTVGSACGVAAGGGTVQPPAPGGGGGGGAAAPVPTTGMGGAGGVVPAAAMLPDTASSSFAKIAAVATGSLLALIGCAKLGTFAYARYVRSQE